MQSRDSINLLWDRTVVPAEVQVPSRNTLDILVRHFIDRIYDLSAIYWTKRVLDEE